MFVMVREVLSAERIACGYFFFGIFGITRYFRGRKSKCRSPDFRAKNLAFYCSKCYVVQ
jgi:hypothetical protein